MHLCSGSNNARINKCFTIRSGQSAALDSGMCVSASDVTKCVSGEDDAMVEEDWLQVDPGLLESFVMLFMIFFPCS